jgi:hypothetical protein
MAEQLMAVRQQPVHFAGIVVNHFHFHMAYAQYYLSINTSTLDAEAF